MFGAKFAAVGFSEGLRSELGRKGVRVVTIAPGLMRTGSYENAYFKGDKEKEATISTNANAVLRRIQQDSQMLKDRKVQWVGELEEQLYSARCEENKLQQVFTRVIENAAEAGAVVPRITVQTRNSDLQATLQDANLRLQPGCYICVEISDNGKGIPPEILPRVFEPFFTTKPGHKGLGLAWVYGAVTNAGAAWARSERDASARVDVVRRGGHRFDTAQRAKTLDSLSLAEPERSHSAVTLVANYSNKARVHGLPRLLDVHLKS